MKKAYKWMISQMKGKLEKIREKRDERFRRRIDRVYFRQDINGIKHMEGNYRLNGNFWTTGFLSAHAPVKEDEYRALLEFQDSLVNISPKPSGE